MIEVVVTIEVDRPPAAVFAYWADWTNNPQWQSGMRRCTWTSEPPLRLGSTYDQEAVFLGRTIRTPFEVVEHEPDRRLRIRSRGGPLSLDITREVEPLPNGGSRLRATVRGEPKGLMGMLGPLTRRMVERNVRADYDRLRALLASDGTNAG